MTQLQNTYYHTPVLLTETLNLLDIQPTDIILDGTLGFAGHSYAMQEKLNSQGMLIGLDQDPKAIQYCKSLFQEKPNIHIFASNFKNFDMILNRQKIPKVNKILLDLGISSYQLDQSQRGFTFQNNQILDMRMDSNSILTASKILNTYSENQLTQIFINYGNIHRPQKLIQNILFQRKKTSYRTSNDLLSTIKKSFFFKNNRSYYIRTVSQIFQSLRIEVNQELESLKIFLNKLPKYLASNAKIAIISFHSGEDRIVKNYIKANKHFFQSINKRVIKPTQSEIKQNSRSKSAKLRVFQSLK